MKIPKTLKTAEIPKQKPQKKRKLEPIVNFLYEVGTLRKLDRIHKQMLFENDPADNIASHSYRVMMISWFLAKAEKADPYKVLMMCLFHDTAEARSNDHNWVHKKYVKIFEEEIVKDQLAKLPWKEELTEISHEYGERLSLEAKVAKDADSLDQILLLKEYVMKGNKEAERWLAQKDNGKRLFTSTAKELVKEMVNQSPSDWWKNIWTDVNR